MIYIMLVQKSLRRLLRKWAVAVGFAYGVICNALNCQSMAGLLMQSSRGTDGNFGATALSNSGEQLVVSKGGYLYG